MALEVVERAPEISDIDAARAWPTSIGRSPLGWKSAPTGERSCFAAVLAGTASLAMTLPRCCEL